MEGNEGKKPGHPPNPSPFLSIFNATIIVCCMAGSILYGNKDAKLEKTISLKDPVEELSKSLETSLYLVNIKHFISVPQVEELKTLRNYLVQQ